MIFIREYLAAAVCGEIGELLTRKFEDKERRSAGSGKKEEGNRDDIPYRGMGPGMARERLDFRFEYAAPRLRETEGFLSRLARFYLAEPRHGVMLGEIRSLAIAGAASRSGSDFEANVSPR